MTSRRLAALTLARADRGVLAAAAALTAAVELLQWSVDRRNALVDLIAADFARDGLTSSTPAAATADPSVAVGDRRWRTMDLDDALTVALSASMQAAVGNSRSWLACTLAAAASGRRATLREFGAMRGSAR